MQSDPALSADWVAFLPVRRPPPTHPGPGAVAPGRREGKRTRKGTKRKKNSPEGSLPIYKAPCRFPSRFSSPDVARTDDNRSRAILRCRTLHPCVIRHQIYNGNFFDRKCENFTNIEMGFESFDLKFLARCCQIYERMRDAMVRIGSQGANGLYVNKMVIISSVS